MGNLEGRDLPESSGENATGETTGIRNEKWMEDEMRNERGFRAIVVAMTLLIIMMVFGTIGAIQGAQAQGEDCIQLYVNGSLVFESDACNVADPTATPTPEPDPTDTPQPTYTPTPEPDGNGVPDPDDPACTDHVDRSLHGLNDTVHDCH